MSRKRYTPEEIIGMLREAEVRLSQGEKIGLICKGLGISGQSYYRWRREYGGLKVDQVKRLKDLEKENARLGKAVSDLMLDKRILNEALSQVVTWGGNQAPVVTSWLPPRLPP